MIRWARTKEDKTGESDDGGDGEDQEDDEGEAKDKLRVLYLWENHELVARELLNCFDVKTAVH